MKELYWRSFGIACLLTGGLAVLVALIEACCAVIDSPPSSGEILYGIDIHLLLAVGTSFVLRLVTPRRMTRSFPAVALGGFLALEFAVVGAYWLAEAPFMPPLHTLAGRIAMLCASAMGILLGMGIGRLVVRRMPRDVYLRPARGAAGAAGVLLAVLLTVGNAVGLIKVLPNPSQTTRRVVANDALLPDVYVILVDTLRRDHLSCFGYARPTTPNIDRLFDQSWVFANAYCPSTWTTPSVASLFTGLYPNTHRVFTATRVVPDEAPTLAEHFRSYGYRTGAFVANGTITTSNGFGQGFGTFFPPGPPRWSYRQRTAIEQIATRLRRPGNASRGWRINKEVIDWVVTHPGEPRFAYVHYMEPHAPYVPAPSDRDTVAPGTPPGPSEPPNFVLSRRAEGASAECSDWECLAHPPTLAEDSLAGMIANYDGEILRVDRRVGDLLERLDELGALESAHVIFCSDHGEEFADHHGWAHVNSIYEEIAACPLAYRPPGGLPGGSLIERPVGMLDVVRTVIALLDLDTPPLHQGELIPEMLSGAASARERPVLCAMPPNLFSLRLGRWKLLRRGTVADPVWRLFDMIADPWEQTDLAPAHPDTVSYLRGYLDGMIADQSLSPLAEIGSTADPELLRQLKNLGYVR